MAAWRTVGPSRGSSQVAALAGIIVGIAVSHFGSQVRLRCSGALCPHSTMDDSECSSWECLSNVSWQDMADVYLEMDVLPMINAVPGPAELDEAARHSTMRCTGSTSWRAGEQLGEAGEALGEHGGGPGEAGAPEQPSEPGETLGETFGEAHDEVEQGEAGAPEQLGEHHELDEPRLTCESGERCEPGDASASYGRGFSEAVGPRPNPACYPPGRLPHRVPPNRTGHVRWFERYPPFF